ncbi:MAG: TonB-dependent receptor, partial [Candidatus Omnitrophica bacterium]|nr:TonB-dependent receptor [Candidatus Omnitrophota bacterium]
ALFAGYSHRFLCGLAMDANIRSDHFSEFGWEISPSASVGYELNDRVKIRAAVDRAYRVPSFTDLYYVSPGNIGNANLKPESAWSYEAGTEYKDKFLKISNTVFNRNAERTIDWVRNSAADPWRAVNSGRIDTFGVENAIEVKTGEILNNIFVERVRLGYDFITSEKRRGSEAFSKYAMDYLRHNLSLETGSRLPFGIENTFRCSYKRRFDQHGYFFLENKTSKKIDIAGFHAEFYIEGTNLLNTSYEEVTGVPAPGIWIVGGMEAQF